MGVVKNVGFDTFPEQGTWLGRNVDVCFNHDTTKIIRGVIVREDNEAPGVLIIQLSDGRFVLATECQFRILREEECRSANTVIH
ncbi:hypothetical protein [Vibrio phage JSF12]|uniref:Uncharacterized protein n=2 Tax=Jesfedecavirus TaxID=2560156 RepID=A0A2D0YLN6_9CAUD|nr:hypothetical protein FDI98_gp143 [Vibrio phage JSF10]YP_009794724.1 hypothetical protein HOS35_gp041 [Vibrio phage JSF12]ASV43389.1 hypothetical protein [Vibrio phage JSF10]ASV43559.1 hypothetical protein [Vibrio phage JSF12]